MKSKNVGVGWPAGLTTAVHRTKHDKNIQTPPSNTTTIANREKYASECHHAQAPLVLTTTFRTDELTQLLLPTLQVRHVSVPILEVQQLLQVRPRDLGEVVPFVQRLADAVQGGEGSEHERERRRELQGDGSLAGEEVLPYLRSLSPGLGERGLKSNAVRANGMKMAGRGFTFHEDRTNTPCVSSQPCAAGEANTKADCRPCARRKRWPAPSLSRGERKNRRKCSRDNTERIVPTTTYPYNKPHVPHPAPDKSFLFLRVELVDVLPPLCQGGLELSQVETGYSLHRHTVRPLASHTTTEKTTRQDQTK